MAIYNRSRSIRALGAIVFSLACISTAHASNKTTNTILGAGLGAAAGAVFSEGDPLYTLGGAAAGGVLGNILTENERDHRSYRSKHSSHPKHRYVSHPHGKKWSSKHKHHKHRHHRR